MTEQMWTLLLQVPLVGVFIAYTVYMSKIVSQQVEMSNNTWRQFINERDLRQAQRNEEFRSFITTRDEMWQQFLRGMEEANVAGLREAANGLSKMSAQITRLTVITMRHDALLRQQNGETTPEVEATLRELAEVLKG